MNKDTGFEPGHEIVRDDDNRPSNPTPEPTLGDVIIARYTRRQTLQGVSAVAAISALGIVGGVMAQRPGYATTTGSSLTFEEISHGMAETHAVAPGYEAQTLIRWGDPVGPGAPEFDPDNQSPELQAQQWGYNNDFIAFMPLPKGSETADHGLLCVNFEYTDTHLMFPGLQDGDADKVTKEQADIELAAHGHGIIEIIRDKATQSWSYAKDSTYNRRISALKTTCSIAGPAAGHPRLKTSADPTGTRVIGTLNNCAGGKTPWGTILIAEENFHQYFGGDPEKTPEARNYARYGIKGKPRNAWWRYHDRFNVEHETNEPNRFGWMVEIDPYHPQSTPVKRTALGRFKHEGATSVVNKDGRVVVYSGDDQRFDYLYKFVSSGTFDPDHPQASRDLLDRGTLYVAKFHDDGRLTWLPLVYGTGPLTEDNDFASQADVLIETRRAADLLGATPMDRPEDVEPNPVTGLVYMALTNNTKRKGSDTDAANPRGPNPHGHVMEMIPPGGRGAEKDHAATEYTWKIFILGGDPRTPGDGGRYHPDTTQNGWLSCPDNVAFDRLGRIWIATDGAPKHGFADGVWAADTEGEGRALTRHFYRTPLGAELCGPEFNPDSTAYFAAVQHPGDTRDSTFDRPSTRWPDFAEGMPPRPSVQVIVKTGGGVIGT